MSDPDDVFTCHQRKTTRWKDLGVKVADTILHHAFLWQRYVFRRHNPSHESAKLWEWAILHLCLLLMCLPSHCYRMPSPRDGSLLGGAGPPWICEESWLWQLILLLHSYSAANLLFVCLFGFFWKFKCLSFQALFRLDAEGSLVSFLIPPAGRTLVMDMEEFNTLWTKRILLGRYLNQSWEQGDHQNYM